MSSNPIGGNFIFLLKLFKPLNVNIVQKCQICVENENPEYLMTRSSTLLVYRLFPHMMNDIISFDNRLHAARLNIERSDCTKNQKSKKNPRDLLPPFKSI